MAVTGSYLASQVRNRVARPVRSLRECIFRDVLPAFGNLEARADQKADEFFYRAGSQPVWEDQNEDMALVAEAAEDFANQWFESMTSVRQAMRNLLAAGLFHLTEQQLADSCRDDSFCFETPNDSRLEDVADWYQKHFRLDLKTLRSWNTVDELRFVTNGAKHGEGPAIQRLRSIRPELFTNPDYVEFYQEIGAEPPASDFVPAPLSGEGLFVSERLLRIYADAALSFFDEIAEHFQSHADEHYPS